MLGFDIALKSRERWDTIRSFEVAANEVAPGFGSTRGTDMDFEFAVEGWQLLGVVIGSVLYMVLSMVWYMPKVFGTIWMKDEGLDEEVLRENASPFIYVVTLIMALISNISIALILSHVGGGWMNGLIVGLLIGVGIAGMAIGPHYLFALKKRLAVIQMAHAGLLITVSGVIIGALT